MALDSEVVGISLVFSPSSQQLCDALNIPETLKDGSHPVVVLLSQILTPGQIKQLNWRLKAPSEPTKSSKAFIKDVDRLRRTLRTDPAYHRALRILDFPKEVHAYMSEGDRPFLVWHMRGSADTDGNLETEALLAIMKQCGAKRVAHNKDVRVVFVHVGALQTLHDLTALMERRSKRFEITFYTYGSHPSVPPDQWGTYIIYPRGNEGII